MTTKKETSLEVMNQSDEVNAVESAIKSALAGALNDAPVNPVTMALMERIGYSCNMQVDVESRTIFILQDIDENLVRRFLPTFYILDSTPGRITICMTSDGGSIFSGIAIFSAIQNAKNRVAVFATGNCFSMAAIILQAADERALDEHCRFLIHSGESSIGGNTQDNLAHAAEMKRLLEWNINMVAKRSKLSVKKVRELFSQETYLSPKECVKLGLADYVVKTRKRQVWKKS